MLSRLSTLLGMRPRPRKGRSLQLLIDAHHLLSLSPTTNPLPPPLEWTSTMTQLMATHLRTHLHAGLLDLLQSTFKQTSTRPFRTSVSPSTVPNAGNGLFLHGTAAAGTLLAIYPGQCLPPSSRHTHHPHAHCIARYDGYIIDAMQTPQMEMQVEYPIEDMEHPFGQGHFINHPPKQVQPNVLQFMMDVELDNIPKEFRGLLPVIPFEEDVSMLQGMENLAVRQQVKDVELFRSAKPDRLVVRTVAFVAIRDIHEEELFYDYRFPPGVSWPEWYWPCDEEAAERRWKKGGLFL